MVDHIFNGEQGVKVRDKLNEVIDRTNALMGVENHGQQGGNPHGTKASQVTQTNDNLGPNVQTALDKLDQRQSSDNSNNSSHANNKNNPHEVKADQVPQSNAELGDSVQDALNDLYGSVVELVEMLPEKADLDHIDGLDTHIQLRRGTNPLEAWNKDMMVAELFFHYTKGQLWSKLNDGTMVLIGSQSFIEDAPQDGYTYGREDGQWIRVGATEVGDDRPENPVVGTLWYDTGHTCELYVYDGNHWVSMTGGGGSGDGEFPENIVLDDAAEMLKNVALAREIDDNGDGVWRQITTSDLVTENNQPMFRDSSGRFTKSSEAEIRNQQQANWYLRDRIVEGVEKQDEIIENHEGLQEIVEEGLQLQASIQQGVDLLNDKVTALEGAVGEHSFIYRMSEAPDPGYFSITNESGATNTVSDGTKINLTLVDRNGNAVDVDRITVGDVLRLADIGQENCELRITSVDESPTFSYTKLSGNIDRLSDYPYDFVMLSQFDPAGLATIAYVDERDDTKLDKAGGTVTGNLSVNANSTIISGKEGTSTGQGIFNVKANGPSGRSVFEVRNDGRISLKNASGSTLVASSEDEPMTKKAGDYRYNHTHMLWKYMGVESTDIDASDLKDGEFALRFSGSGEGKKVYIYLSDKDAEGHYWYGHFSGKEYEHGLTTMVSVTNASGWPRFTAKSTSFKFNQANNPYFRCTGEYVKENFSLTRGSYYTCNFPGLLPQPVYSSHWNNTHQRSFMIDDEAGFVDEDEPYVAPENEPNIEGTDPDEVNS
jgi:hypothetical protein